MFFTIFFFLTPLITHNVDSTVTVKIITSLGTLVHVHLHVLFMSHNSCHCVVDTPFFLKVKYICKHNIYIPWLTVGFYSYVNSTQLNYFQQCNKFCVYAHNALLAWNITIVLHYWFKHKLYSQITVWDLDQRYLQHTRIIHTPGNWFYLNYVINTN